MFFLIHVSSPPHSSTCTCQSPSLQIYTYKLIPPKQHSIQIIPLTNLHPKITKMETSQSDLRHRIRDEDQDTAQDMSSTSPETSKERRITMAKGGLKSLSIAVAVPLLLTIANIFLFGSSNAYRATNKQTSFWVPPLWALHGTCLASALLMGVSAWMFWAKDGLRRAPNAVGLYLAQMALSLAWDPLVFRAGANWAGLVVAGALFGLMWRCVRVSREVSPLAADLVKPCLAWAAFLAFVNLKLILASFGHHASAGSA